MPRYGFTSGSEEQFLRVTTSEQMEGVWDLRPTELTLLSASKNGVAYHANYTKRFNIAPSPSTPYPMTTLCAEGGDRGRRDRRQHRGVAKAIRALPVPSQVVMQYQPVDGKMFDENGQAYTSNGAFQWQKGKWVCRGPALPSDAKAYSHSSAR